MVISLQVGIWAVLPEPDAVDIDQPRMRSAERGKIEPEPLDRLAADIDHKQVGLGEQSVQHREVVGRLEIERD